jgi:membrane protease YdiL (CAAX protease family)
MEDKKRFNFTEHPWISFWTLIILVIISTIFSAIVLFGFLGLPQNNPYTQFLQSLTGHFIMIFLIVPYILRLPYGKRTFWEYLKDIRLLQVQPFSQLILITVSCYIILMLCQSLGSIVYRLFEGNAINGEFFRNIFNIKRELPPHSFSILLSFPSMFEEVIFRGVLLTFFLSKFSKLKAILFSSSGFAIIHIFNLVGGRDPIWVAGQIMWSFMLGIFYGYLFIQTGSLLPNMLFHYISNVFVGSFNYYIQFKASIEIQALYGVIFTFGLLPTILLISWIKYYTNKWPLKYALIEQ